MQDKPYRQLVGSLLYACCTRPDISVAVSELAKYMNNPGMSHWIAAKRVCRYLAGTLDRGIHISPSALPKGQELHSWCDSSWGDCPNTRRSRWGNLVYVGETLILWRTKMQKIQAHSTAEAEYRAASATCRDVIWLRYILEELGLPQKKATPIREDNAACIKMVENPMVSYRNKHIGIDCHYIRQLHNENRIKCTKVNSDDNLADLMTKSLEKIKHFKFTNQITIQ